MAHAIAFALMPVAYIYKLVDMHLLSQDFFTDIMSRITYPTKRKQKSHHTRKENPTSSLKMEKPGRETEENSVEQDSDTRNVIHFTTVHTFVNLHTPQAHAISN